MRLCYRYVFYRGGRYAGGINVCVKEWPDAMPYAAAWAHRRLPGFNGYDCLGQVPVVTKKEAL